jgi:hypothetical protein
MNIQEIFNAAVETMAERQFSSTTYCGWGVYVDRMVDEFLDQGGSYQLVRKTLNLAYYSWDVVRPELWLRDAA